MPQVPFLPSKLPNKYIFFQQTLAKKLRYILSIPRSVAKLLFNRNIPKTNLKKKTKFIDDFKEIIIVIEYIGKTLTNFFFF